MAKKMHRHATPPGKRKTGKDKMQHSSHAQQNKAFGLPQDVFAHDGQGYGQGAPSQMGYSGGGPPMGGGPEGGGGGCEMDDNSQCE